MWTWGLEQQIHFLRFWGFKAKVKVGLTLEDGGWFFSGFEDDGAPSAASSRGLSSGTHALCLCPQLPSSRTLTTSV